MEAEFVAAIKAAAPTANVYFDVAASGAPTPYVVVQQVGGEIIDFMGNDLPNLRNARLQVAVWGKSRVHVNALSRAIESAMRTVTTLHAVKPIGALVADYDMDTLLYGARQDFSVWN